MKKTKDIEKTSMLWYSLPILFGLIGGIIGYFLLRKQDRNTAKTLIWIGVVVTLIVTIIKIYYNILPYSAFF
ncbi:hypothetical protein HYX06_04930 [Candidatus Woesearchaeota archaeon]|nr:hypothetical protein [Candidatus Woesearchaeota archaeon]